MAGIWADSNGQHIWAGDVDYESVLSQPVTDIEQYLKTHGFKMKGAEGGRVGELEGAHIWEDQSGQEVILSLGMSDTGIIGLNGVRGMQDLNPFPIITMKDLIAFVELGQEKPNQDADYSKFKDEEWVPSREHTFKKQRIVGADGRTLLK